MNTNTALRILVINILNDDYGITEQNYNLLVEFFGKYFGNYCYDVFEKVEATDGRFYLTEENAQKLIGDNTMNINIGDRVNAITIMSEVEGIVIWRDGSLVTIRDDNGVEHSTSVHVCRLVDEFEHDSIHGKNANI